MLPLADDTLPDRHADLRQRVRVDTTTLDWDASPSGTVWRKPLYRVGGEHGPVTSLVRYAPGGAFRPHAHPEGEEILVLDGVFADEHGDYPDGTYLLNPDGSHHAPRSDRGCLLFVRLRQYPGADRPRIVLDTTTGLWTPGPTPGIAVLPLYAQAGHPERVRLERWGPGAARPRHIPMARNCSSWRGRFGMRKALRGRAAGCAIRPAIPARSVRQPAAGSTCGSAAEVTG